MIFTAVITGTVSNQSGKVLGAVCLIDLTMSLRSEMELLPGLRSSLRLFRVTVLTLPLQVFDDADEVSASNINGFLHIIHEIRGTPCASTPSEVSSPVPRRFPSTPLPFSWLVEVCKRWAWTLNLSAKTYPLAWVRSRLSRLRRFWLERLLPFPSPRFS